MFTLAHLKKFNKRIGLVDEYNKITYSDIVNEIKIIKKKINLSKNNLAVLVSNNCFSYILIYLTCLIYKTKIIILNEVQFKYNLKKIIKKFEPDYIFTKIDISSFKTIKYKRKKTYNDYFVFNLKNKKTKNINPEISILLPTSGSTGAPKLACISYENLIINTGSIIEYLKIRKNSTTITSLSSSYSYGLSVINTHLFVGSKIVINRFSFLDAKFWKLFKTNKVNILYTVPLMCEILFKNIKINDSLKQLKTLCCAGGHLDQKIKRKILISLRKKNIFMMYGQTEASPRISYINISKNKKQIDSIGKAIKGGKLFFKFKDKNLPSKKFPKEIFYKGKNVMLFYANSIKDLENKRSNNYILATGDLGYQDSKNFFYITGRKNRIAKINGVRIDLDLIDRDFKKENIVSVSFNEKIFLCSNKKINDKLRYKISKIYNIGVNNIKILNLNSFPLNTNGKLDYKKLIKLIKYGYK